MFYHVAIPSRDLVESAKFYNAIGGKVGRKYSTHIVIDFFGMQLVPHFSEDEWDRVAKMYPRHFGVIVREEVQLGILWDQYKREDYIFQDYMIRHKGKEEEHHTFFLQDPSNNLIEFKWYKNRSSLF